LWYSDYATITGNTITDNNRHGIFLYSSSFATIIGNTITNNNGLGTFLRNSANATITGILVISLLMMDYSFLVRKLVFIPL